MSQTCLKCTFSTVDKTGNLYHAIMLLSLLPLAWQASKGEEG